MTGWPDCLGRTPETPKATKLQRPAVPHYNLPYTHETFRDVIAIKPFTRAHSPATNL
jgi:hypothetical protein